MNCAVFAHIIDQLNRGESPALTLQADGERYIRRFVNGDRLILLGGGHVSLALYRMALLLDFEITVVDDRPEYCNHQRFPHAQVLCDSFENAIKRMRISERDYICILTRGHQWDQLCVTEILNGTMPYYLGMISSRRRAQGLCEVLLEQGFSDEKLARLHAPIGLDIGAMSTMEIAVSICAEMIAEKHREKAVKTADEMQQTDVNMDLLRYLAASDEPRALLIVLDSSGSTPVKSGSMMAVNALGKGYGTVGGGCSEASAVNRARRMIGSGGSAVCEFDMTNDVAAENGMVCGGVMRVLIEDITAE